MLPRLIDEQQDNNKGHDADDRTFDLTLKNYYASFPEESVVRAVLKNAFVINQPLDQVGGDGYWLHEDQGVIYLVVFDCMGHGRLASIMTRIYISAIKQSIVANQMGDPGDIVASIHERIKNYFESKVNTQVGSGADIGVLKLDTNHSKIQYAGAKMDLVYVCNQQVERLKGNKRQVGDLFEFEHKYETIDVEWDKKASGINIYLFSDGVTDLIGGKQNKKMKFKGFAQMLAEVNEAPFPNHKKILEEKFAKWSGTNHQMDDLLLIGLHIEDDY